MPAIIKRERERESQGQILEDQYSVVCISYQDRTNKIRMCIVYKLHCKKVIIADRKVK
jgi:hypothetical protein